MEYRGWAPSFDRVLIRGNPRDRECLAFWVKDGTVLAAMNANIWDGRDAIEARIRARRPVDLERLADRGIDLAALMETSG